MTVNVASLGVSIGGDPRGLINALNRSTRAITDFTGTTDRAMRRLEQSETLAARGVTRLQTAFAGLGVSLGVREIVQAADAWTLLQGRLGLVTSSTGELQRVQRQLFAVAQQNRQSFDTIGDLYVRIARNSRALGATQDDVLRVTRAVSAAMRIGAGSAGQQSAAITQLGQALSSGVLQGDELRSILENAPVLADALAKALGRSTGELRKMGREGELSSKLIFDALNRIAPEIEAQVQGIPDTVSGALTQLSNSFQRFIGEVNTAGKITQGLVTGLNAIGRAFDTNRAAVETFAVAIGTTGLLRALASLRSALAGVAAVQGVTAFLSLVPAVRGVNDVLTLGRFAAVGFWRAVTGPVGLAVTVIGALSAAFFAWRRRAQETRAELDRIRESVSQLSLTDVSSRILQETDRLFALESQLVSLQHTIATTIGQISAATASGAAPNRALTGDVATLQRQVEQTTNLLKILGEQRKQLAAGAAAPPPKAIFDVDKAVAELTKRIDASVRSLEQMDGNMRVLPGHARAFTSQLTEANRLLKALPDPLGPLAVQLRDAIEKVKDFVAAIGAVERGAKAIQALGKTPVTLSIEVPNVGEIIDRLQLSPAPQLTVPVTLRPEIIGGINLDPFIDAVRRAADAQQQLDFAQFLGGTKAIQTAEQNLARSEAAVRSWANEIIDAMASAGIGGVEAEAIFARLRAGVEGIGGGAKAMDTLGTRVRAITTAGRGLLQVVDSVGGIGEQARRSIDGVLQLGDALSQLSTKGLKGFDAFAARLSGIVGLVGGVASIFSAAGAFGKSPAEQERDRILRANNDELARLRLSVSGLADSITRQQDLARQLSGAETRALIAAVRGIPGSTPRGILESAAKDLERHLRSLGLSLEELNAIARLHGITLLDKEGRIVAAALGQLEDALQLAAREAFRFAQTLEGQTAKLAFRREVFDLEGQAALDDALKVLQQFAPKLFEQFFGGIAPTDLAGLERATRAVVDAVLENERWLQKLGVTGEDFIQLIGGLDSALDSLASATRDATAALINVPQGFNIARARFMAATGVLPTLPEINLDALSPVIPTLDVGKRDITRFHEAADVANAGTVINWSGNLFVDARDKPASELVDAIKTELRTQVRSKVGLSGKPHQALDL